MASTTSPLRNSVVALRAEIPADAFTADTLGTRREGSGIVIRENGLVLTIGYLITEAEEVWLTTHDGRVVAAHPLAYDQETGFGLVQALGDLGLPALPIGKSEGVKIGDAIMLTDGLGRTVEGEIVARQEFAGYWEYLIDDALFVAPAHPSWGGAALVDAQGTLVGVGSLRLQMSQGGAVADINMAVPIDLLTPVLDEMIRSGHPPRQPRPWLGAYTAEHNGEVVVMSVADGGPAEKAGMQSGDVISELRDTSIDGLAEFYRALWSSGPVGTELPLRVVRDGREKWLKVTSGDRGAMLKRPQMQ